MSSPEDEGGTHGVRGLRIIVTGGATGVGAGITEALLDGGATVCVVQRTEESLRSALAESGLEGRVLGIAADLSTPDRCFDAIRDATTALGGLDALVNNSSVTGPPAHRHVLEVDASYLDRVIDLNVKGMIACSVAAARILTANGGGTIVSITSVLAHAPAPSVAVYSASKSAIVAFTRGLALDLGPSGVRAVTISPGDIVTSSSVPPPSDHGRAVRQAALGRRGEPREIGNVVRFVLSDEARYVTGVDIVVDGGFLLT